MADKTLFIFDANSFADSGSPADVSAIAYRPVRLFDADAVESIVTPSVRMPETWTGGALKLIVAYCMVGANTSDDVYCYANIAAMTDGDTGMDGQSFDMANIVTPTVPDLAYEADQFEITLTNDDDVAAGDLITLAFARWSDQDADKATGDMAVFSITLVEVEA